MSVQDILTACAAQGYRADPAAGTVSGVEGGVAFLARIGDGTLEMSVNIPAERLEKLRARVASASPAFGGVTAAHHNFGVLLTLPGAAGADARRLYGGGIPRGRQRGGQARRRGLRR